MGLPPETNKLTEAIIGAAIAVHKALGPGLLETAYVACLAFELHQSGLKVETDVPVPVIYHEVRLECGFKLDMLVENKIVVEVKSVRELAPVHQAQVLTYLKLSDHLVGLLINFNVAVLVDGVKRLINAYATENQRT